MAINLKSLSKSRAVQAPRLIVYGVEKIGKSTFAASAPNVIYQPCEDCGPIESTFLPIAKSYDEVIANLGEVYSQEHEFQTYVLDSLSAFERLVFAKTCVDNGKQGIEEFGYGKGYIYALSYWKALLDGLDAIRNERAMTIILIAHTEVERFNSPLTDPYDQYRLSLHKDASQLLRQWADAVLFINYQTFVQKQDAGFNKSITRGIGTGARLIHTQERPAFLAGNRYNLPNELPFEWGVLSNAIQTSLSPSSVKP